MTLEGEYYLQFSCPLAGIFVAILMTLEGEYYKFICQSIIKKFSRNPHDIGRRILQLLSFPFPIQFWTVAILMTLEGEYYVTAPLTIKIEASSQSSWHWKANITQNQSPAKKHRSCRNPHDIGRRILLYHLETRDDKPKKSQSSWHWKANITHRFGYRGQSPLVVAILMTLEGEYYIMS